MGSSSTALVLKWVFGLNKEVGIISLADEERDWIFFTAGHTGVIVDLRTEKQKHLVGHTNEIRCCCVSKDKRWIATADQGPDSMIILWDSYKASPVRTFFRPHSDHGVQALAFSDDMQLLVSVSKYSSDHHQQISVWQWTVEKDTASLSSFIRERDPQICVKFNPANSQQLISNGHKTVIFWEWEGNSLAEYCPPLSSRDFKHAIGQLTVSTFIPSIFSPDAQAAICATSEGDIVLWDLVEHEGEFERRAVKVVRLHDSSINCLMVIKDYIVTGGQDGFIRFFDFQFRLVAWFEDINAGPICSISFSNRQLSPSDFEENVAVVAPELYLSSKRGLVLSLDPRVFEDLDAKKREGKVLLQFQDSAIYGLATHPYLHQLAVIGQSGLLQVWEYYTEGKKLRITRKFDKLQGHSLAFDPKGDYLAIGFMNGTVKIISARNLKDVAKGIFRNSKECITDIIFSQNSTFMATSDAEYCVSLYKCLRKKIDEEDNQDEWYFIGKYRSHYQPITGIMFVEDANTRLLSIGEDRSLVEYDVDNSAAQNRLIVKNITKIEQAAKPTSFVLQAISSSSGTIPCILLANDLYKLKLLNLNSKLTTQTILGPSYGGPLNRMLQVPGLSDPQRGFLAYTTHEKVIGLIQLPIDGNPHKSTGVIAHPGQVANLVVSYDGKYAFTCGGPDLTVNMWAIELQAFNTAQESTDLAPFTTLIEGGTEGRFWKEIQEYFFYSQIKSQGEDSTHPHTLGGSVPLRELPNIMRALGYYPSEKDVEDLVQEVRLHNANEDPELTLTVYVNHRPVFGVTKEQIQHAFEVISKVYFKTDGDHLSLQDLTVLLSEKGERMSAEEIDDCLLALLGDEHSTKRDIELSPHIFAQEILGFEDY